MPTRPKTFRAPNQPTRQQQQRQHDRQRGTASSRGYDAAWARYAKLFRRDPLNVVCIIPGCRSLSAHVDHIIASVPGDDGWWDANNHQALCAYHHRIKSTRFDGACGRPPDTSPEGKAELARMLAAAAAREAAIERRMEA